MITKTLVRKFAFMVVIVAMLFASVRTSQAQSPIPNGKLNEVIEGVLSAYSEALSGTNEESLTTHLAPAMQDLVRERQKFYYEFFEVGLHSDLISLQSEFVVNSSMKYEAQKNDRYVVSVAEIVVFHGRYRSEYPEDTPLVQAGQWALSQTDNEAVEKGIEAYIQDKIVDVKAASSGGFDITFVVEHSLVIERVKSGYQIVQDSFTDKASDNPSGFDNINWANGSFVRSKPDLTKMPNYVMYVTPVEELGKDLLDIYTQIYGEMSKASPLGGYNRTNAHTYADRWTSNTSLTSTTCGTVKRDDTKWNPNYTKWNCDCANYVSQSLNAGGIPTDGTWYKDSGAWIRVNELIDWLVDTKHYANKVSSLYSLQVGDISTTSTESHVVIVVSSFPFQYNGHTNDRLHYPWSSSLTEYYTITY